MSRFGPAWLGDDGAACIYREMWAGRITEVNLEPGDEDDWCFTALLLPVDGVGAVRHDAFAVRLIPPDERELIRLGSVVLLLREIVRRGRSGSEGRSAVRLRRDELGRETWARTA